MNGKRKSTAGGPSGKAPEAKKPLHSFFTGGAKDLGDYQPSPPTLIHFLHNDPFTYPSSASASITMPSASTSTLAGPSTAQKVQIIFYDLDGTLIKPASGNKWPSSRTDWAWWHPSVPQRLKQEVDEGYHLVVISNQGASGEKPRAEWRAKIPLIAAKIPSIPIRVLAATSMGDVYRKPNIGMYQTVEKLYRDKGYEIDLENSVFVGDAAGRPRAGGKEKDHSNTDFQFAVNVGLKFLTPEEHFLNHPRPSFPEPPVGFRPSLLGGLAALPPIVPSHTPIIHPETEIVLFVGPPASGKTSFFRRHFAPRGYEHVNQDTLGTRDRCLARAEAYITSGKKSVVVDNTNRNKATRALYIDLAERLNIPIRLFHFLCPVELARHNNVYRAVYAPKDDPPRTLLPRSAFTSYTNAFEAPSKDEGFDEIRGVNFVWEGTDEQRRFWDMYMLETK